MRQFSLWKQTKNPILTNQSNANLEPSRPSTTQQISPESCAKLELVKPKKAKSAKGYSSLRGKEEPFSFPAGKTSARIRIDPWRSWRAIMEERPKSADPSSGGRRRRFGSSEEDVKRRSLGSVLEQTVFSFATRSCLCFSVFSFFLSLSFSVKKTAKPKILFFCRCQLPPLNLYLALSLGKLSVLPLASACAIGSGVYLITAIATIFGTIEWVPLHRKYFLILFFTQ